MQPTSVYTKRHELDETRRNRARGRDKPRRKYRNKKKKRKKLHVLPAGASQREIEHRGLDNKEQGRGNKIAHNSIVI